MPHYEYRVVPAPQKGVKAKGVRTAEARFSHGLQGLMNEMGAAGWEYQRAEMLPSIERAGLTSTTTQWRNVLVFRRVRPNDLDAFAPELLPAPELPGGAGAPAVQPADDADIQAPHATPATQPDKGGDDATDADAPEDQTIPRAGATQMLRDNGVEEVSDVAGITNSLKKLAANRSSARSKD